MRGKDIIHLTKPPIRGITPAYAGKRKQSVLIIVLTSDHPRVCGEKSGNLFWSNDGGGSPPRMRGKVILTNLL